MTIRLTKIAVGALLLSSLSGCVIYQSIGKSTGGFLHPVSGPDFVHIDNDDWDSGNALIYFYRAHSQWASEEIESPSVYIDDRHYFNIRNNSFTWMEVKPGERYIAMRRPLMGLEGMNDFSLSLIADATLTVDAGQVYYLRYSEVSTPESPHPDLDPEHPLASGDLQLVTRDSAMGPGEIVTTQFLNSDLLAPNHAATSIAVVNEDDDYERDMERLTEAREEELERLETDGLVNAPWYWPFGGEPQQPLETDAKIKARERAYAKLEREREVQAAREAGDGWWPF
ncbi:DUF2846 domain-containing protein [Marinobacter caseinilyticus]|uniref:DUF2846 domain-containing protein n=1 Tax=Marinobacter caseinilyticus TaxID=2692195 RepID=UPI00140B88A2|nr:DUF2846 domain-containing protein [Marinobacter caseinilyticus]